MPLDEQATRHGGAEHADLANIRLFVDDHRVLSFGGSVASSLQGDTSEGCERPFNRSVGRY
jgi:hypothetical protein